MNGSVVPALPTGVRPSVVVMGVTACGKSTVAARLADALGIEWLDADDLHPGVNIAKMAAGQPLTDKDRWPWLERVGAELASAAERGGLVVACSALRRAYRDRFRAHAPETLFVHLTGSPELLSRRAASRAGHFMPASLLASQLALLEPLDEDERGVKIDIAASPAEIVRSAAEWINANG